MTDEVNDLFQVIAVTQEGIRDSGFNAVECRAIARALSDAGWRPPARVIRAENAADILALPYGTLLQSGRTTWHWGDQVLTEMGWTEMGTHIHFFNGDGALIDGGELWEYLPLNNGPLVVIWEPDQ